MKENKCEELKELLQKIERAVELYNGINPTDKIALTKQDEAKDVSDTFLCVYNEKCIGLFKRIAWHEDKDYRQSEYYYNAGNIYVGIDSNYIGIKTTHRSGYNENKWEKAGTKVTISGKSYIANCNMKNGMSFDDMRLIMYNEGKINSYKIGQSNPDEILEVLSYAQNYYLSEDQKQVTKKKV